MCAYMSNPLNSRETKLFLVLFSHAIAHVHVQFGICVQWNLYIVDTIGKHIPVLIVEVSLRQG